MLRVGSPTILWNKIMKEVRLKRFAGPFKKTPFKHYIQSPVGLVPKDGGRATRLIFHLSHPKSKGTLVNANTPPDLCSLNYADFDEAVQLCLNYINASHDPIYVAKSDVESAFRVLGLDIESWPWTVLKARSPIDQKIYFFVDKCLPFGSSISCTLFQKVSDAVAYLVRFKTKLALINYLDDYLFVAAFRWACDQQVTVFMGICKEINLLVSISKMHWATTSLQFLGLLLDCINFLVLIPVDKVLKGQQLICELLELGKKKTTVLKLQQVCRFLNFLCKAIVPSRAFTRRLYS